MKYEYNEEQQRYVSTPEEGEEDLYRQEGGEICPDCDGTNMDLIGNSGGGCPSCCNGRVYR